MDMARKAKVQARLQVAVAVAESSPNISLEESPRPCSSPKRTRPCHFYTLHPPQPLLNLRPRRHKLRQLVPLLLQARYDLGVAHGEHIKQEMQTHGRGQLLVVG